MPKRSKESMIKEMKECGWHTSVDKSSSYDDVKAEYDTFIDETSDDSLLYPNGRDFDAEDED